MWVISTVPGKTETRPGGPNPIPVGKNGTRAERAWGTPGRRGASVAVYFGDEIDLDRYGSGSRRRVERKTPRKDVECFVAIAPLIDDAQELARLSPDPQRRSTQARSTEEAIIISLAWGRGSKKARILLDAAIRAAREDGDFDRMDNLLELRQTLQEYEPGRLDGTNGGGSSDKPESA